MSDIRRVPASGLPLVRDVYERDIPLPQQTSFPAVYVATMAPWWRAAELAWTAGGRQQNSLVVAHLNTGNLLGQQVAYRVNAHSGVRAEVDWAVIG